MNQYRINTEKDRAELLFNGEPLLTVNFPVYLEDATLEEILSCPENIEIIDVMTEMARIANAGIRRAKWHTSSS